MNWWVFFNIDLTPTVRPKTILFKEWATFFKPKSRLRKHPECMILHYLPQTPSRNDHLHDPFRQLDLNSDDLIFFPTCPCDNLPYFLDSNTGMLQFNTDFTTLLGFSSLKCRRRSLDFLCTNGQLQFCFYSNTKHVALYV